MPTPLPPGIAHWRDYGRPPYCLLDDDALARFRETGILPLPRADERGPAIEDRLWHHLAAAGFARHDPGTWRGPVATLRELKDEPFFNDLRHYARLTAALDDLLGIGGWSLPATFGRFFVDWPEGSNSDLETWPLPTAWHWDGRPDREALGPGVWILQTAADLAPRAGGTVVITGSHRVLERFFRDLAPGQRDRPSQRQRRDFLARHAWFRALCAGEHDHDAVHALRAGDLHVDGIRLGLADCHGPAGSALLTHPWILHSRPERIGPRPRLTRIGFASRCEPRRGSA